MADHLLDIEGLHYTYSDGTKALRGVDLRLTAGEKVGLVGPNGSGKSTLLMCISGLSFGVGQLRVEGEALTSSNAKKTRGRVGLVFQSPEDQLFMPTLADDLAFGPINQGRSEADVSARVERVAEQMALTDMLDRPPHHLSMGQKRIAAIASVLVMEPLLLLMDEPSSNLDPRSRRRLMDVLAGLETGMLIASHDLDMVGRVCRRVALIDEGRIVTDGPAREVLADASLMERHGLEVWQDHAG